MQALAYCLDWGRTMLASGYLCGLYVGYSAVLSPESLYALPSTSVYWSDAGHRTVAKRGVAIQQRAAVTIADVQFDTDLVAPDALGGLPVVAAAG